jgi:NADPH:quinone reductase-like Zn-dependent oxidoreductase
MAGVVEEIEPGVTAFKVSDEVYGMTGGVGGIQGSLAQYAAVDADLLAFIMSYSGIVDRAHLKAGQTVLSRAEQAG